MIEVKNDLNLSEIEIRPAAVNIGHDSGNEENAVGQQNDPGNVVINVSYYCIDYFKEIFSHIIRKESLHWTKWIVW